MTSGGVGAVGLLLKLTSRGEDGRAVVMWDRTYCVCRHAVRMITPYEGESPGHLEMCLVRLRFGSRGENPHDFLPRGEVVAWGEDGKCTVLWGDGKIKVHDRGELVRTADFGERGEVMALGEAGLKPLVEQPQVPSYAPRP